MAGTHELRIAVMMQGSFGGFGQRVLRGVGQWVRLNPGWRIAYFDGDTAEMTQLMRTWQGDGVLCTIGDEEFLEAAKVREFPIVNLTSRLRDQAIPSVIADDRVGGILAAEYFLDRGFRHFAVLGSLEMAYSRDRVAGFSARIREAGHTVSQLNVELGDEEKLGRLLNSLPRPVALFSTSDRRAAAALEACYRVGLKVPDEVAVLGTGNAVELCELCTPPLASVDLDMSARGREGAALLYRLLSGDVAPSEPVRNPPTGVVVRRSADAYVFGDPNLSKALRFIHDRAAQSIKVNDVVAATDVSRRSLEIRFRKQFSRSIHEEIWRVHFDRAKLLLTTTDLSLQLVAEKSGFRTASALANLFKQQTGLTPRTYRAEHGGERGGARVAPVSGDPWARGFTRNGGGAGGGRRGG